MHLLGSVVSAFFGGFLLFLFLFNCSSSRWIGRNQAAGKRFTLYLPVILDSGPICRSKLLFCITLCHRTHPFSLKINPEIMYHPALPDAPPEINSSSFSVSVKNRRYRILTSGFRVPVGFFFFLLSIFNSGYIITGVCGAVKRFFEEKTNFFKKSVFFLEIY